MEREYVVKVVYETEVSEKRLNDLNKSLDLLQKENKELINSNKKISDSFETLSKKTNETKKSQSGLVDVFGQLSSKGIETVGATNASAKSMLDMGKSAMVATGYIGAIVAVLSALFAAYSSTDKGGKDLAKGMAYLGGVVSKITGDIGGLVVKLVDYLKSPVGLIKDLSQVFEDFSTKPVESLQKLGKAVYDNIVLRMKGSANVVIEFGNLLVNTFKGDLDAAGKSLVKMGDAVVQSATGIEDASGKVATYSAELDKAGDMGIKLAAAEKALALSLAVTQGQLDKLTASQELAQQAADDATLSYTARKKAQEESIALSEKVAKKELDLANLTLSVTAQKVAADKAFNRSTSESSLAYQEALNVKQTAEISYNQKTAELATIRRQLLADESESNLDIIIDGWDSAKAVIERQIADAGGSLEDYNKLNDELKKSANLSDEERLKIVKKLELTEEDSINKRKDLNKQLGSITVKAYQDMEKELKTWASRNGDALTEEINLTELSTMADSKQLNEKIKSFNLSEVQQVRLLEMIREKRAADADLYDASKQLAVEEYELYKKTIEGKSALDKKYVDDKKAFDETVKQDTASLGAEELLAYEKLLNEKYAATVAIAYLTGEDTVKITKEYADKQTAIDTEKNLAALQGAAQVLGDISGLLKENTIAYKVIASAKIVMDTIVASFAAYKSALEVPVIGLALAPIAAATTAALGAASLAKLNGVEFADGGNTLAALGGKAKGNSHSSGGIQGSIGGKGFEFEGGEYIVNKTATSNNESAIATINTFGRDTKFKAVPMYEGGGMVGVNVNAPIAAQISLENSFRNALASLPSPVVSVVDINTAADRVKVANDNSTF